MPTIILPEILPPCHGNRKAQGNSGAKNGCTAAWQGVRRSPAIQKRTNGEYWRKQLQGGSGGSSLLTSHLFRVLWKGEHEGLWEEGKKGHYWETANQIHEFPIVKSSKLIVIQKNYYFKLVF